MNNVNSVTMNALDKQTLALAGVFQSAALVDKLAKTGQLDAIYLENSLRTILNLNPESFEDVFESKQHLAFGLKSLNDALARNGRGVSREVLQYAMAIIAVQGKLSKRRDLMDSLGKELDRAVEQQQYFGDFLHDSVIAAAARCYQNSVSKLNFRIRVTGNPTYLQDPKTAEKVRTLLLYGVRCALLWRQNGGRRWDFMVNRQKLKNNAQKHMDVA